IRVIHIVEHVARDTRRGIERHLPPGGPDVPDPPTCRPDGAAAQVVRTAGRPGVLEEVDEAALVALARRHDALVAVVPFAGDFVAAGMPVLEVWSAAPLPERPLLRAIRIGSERTPYQDPAFGFRQLVDVA